MASIPVDAVPISRSRASRSPRGLALPKRLVPAALLLPSLLFLAVVFALLALEQNRRGAGQRPIRSGMQVRPAGHGKAARSSERSANNPCPPAAAALARETAARRRC